ncbi:hypothetical protein BH23ACT1_BH23ACT1_03910 [soil metagenome]
MPRVGDRQRAAVVVGLMAVLVLIALVPASPPAAAQGFTVPTTAMTEVGPSSTVESPTSTTATLNSTTTVPSTSTSVAAPSTTTNGRGSQSPASSPSTARGVSTTTTALRTSTTADVDDSPSTTTRADVSPSASRSSTPPTEPSLPIEQAASSTGLSTGSLVTLVVAGLLGVALALSLLTVRYVRATRPGDSLMG